MLDALRRSELIRSKTWVGALLLSGECLHVFVLECLLLSVTEIPEAVNSLSYRLSVSVCLSVSFVILHYLLQC